MESASLILKFFLLAFSALLPVINPLGSALILLGVAGNAPGPVFRKLALKIAIRTTLFLVIVELVGTALLRFFGISLPVVQVAGGLVLATIGWTLLNQAEPQTSPDQAQVAEVSFESLQEKIFYPLTFPLTAGPGCIVVMLTLSAQASMPRILDEAMTHLGIFLAVVIFEPDCFCELWICTEDHGTYFTADCTWHPARHFVCVVVHWSADHVEWHGCAAEDYLEGLEKRSSGQAWPRVTWVCPTNLGQRPRLE
jgi:multiple antibiotic resistance protein